MNKAEMGTQELESLLELPHFRAFLAKVLNYRYAHKGKINYADFSRRAGFHSRSYLPEIISGKKGLSHDSLWKITNTLKLPQKYAKLFELLAQRDNSLLRPWGTNEKALNLKINALKKEIRNINSNAKIAGVKNNLVCLRFR